MTDEEAGGVGVTSEPRPDGSYAVVLELDADRASPLDEEAAVAHARAVVRVTAEAEHDAAVLRQLAATGIAPEVARKLVAELRAHRPAPAWPTLLELVPGVSAFTGRAFLHLHIDGKAVGQWTPDDARGHAMHVLEAAAVAELDAAYRRTLVDDVDVGEARALDVVADLGAHR